MPIYRVTIEEPAAMRGQRVYMRAEVSADAVAEVQRLTSAEAPRGVRCTAVSIDPGLIPPGEPIVDAPPRPIDVPPSTLMRPDALRERPVRTIAAGVFLGMLAFAVFSFVLGLILKGLVFAAWHPGAPWR